MSENVNTINQITDKTQNGLIYSYIGAVYFIRHDDDN